jgi:hypothetical protein
VIALGWGVWAEVGMAASAAQRMGLGGGDDAPEVMSDYPLFDGKRVQAGRGGLLRASYLPGRVWFLDEHRTAQRQAVLPGTAYLELARAALRELGESGPFEVADLYFFPVTAGARRSAARHPRAAQGHRGGLRLRAALAPRPRGRQRRLAAPLAGHAAHRRQGRCASR